MSHDRGHQSYHVSRAEWRLRCAYFAHSINKFKAMLSHPVRRQYTLEVWNIPFRASSQVPVRPQLTVVMLPQPWPVEVFGWGDALDV
jgi:hypothetical protein